MPEELALYITEYGYLALFSLILLQELGVPNPVPSELILVFAGYLASVGTLNVALILTVVIIADCIGTSVLYFLSYSFGGYLLDHKPRWLPISKAKIEKLSEVVSRKGLLGIYIGRLTPYLRGYTSIAAGFLKIKPKVFLIAVLVSAVTWSSAYVFIGRIMGRYWEKFASQWGGFYGVILLFISLLIMIYVVRYLVRRRKRKLATRWIR